MDAWWGGGELGNGAPCLVEYFPWFQSPLPFHPHPLSVRRPVALWVARCRVHVRLATPVSRKER